MKQLVSLSERRISSTSVSRVQIRDYLAGIAAGYNMNSLHSPGHELLRRAPEVFVPLIPGGLRVAGSGGKGTPTFTPWVGIFDPDEAPTPEAGIYLVWIFKRDLDEVVLTLLQGVTALGKKIGFAESYPVLKLTADRIRGGFKADLSGLDYTANFGKDRRQAGYTAATIIAKTYQLSNLPSEENLRHDLRRMLRLYQESIWVKKSLQITVPGEVITATPPIAREPGEESGGFKPKSREDYFVEMNARRQRRRGDRHELLLSQYAEFATGLGHRPRNIRVHPRDMTMQVQSNEWLVEAKVVYNGNASQAARAAIGQLFEYAHIYYDADKRPGLMALFTEPIGALYVEVLERLGIAAVWKGESGWEASELAHVAGLMGDQLPPTER